MRKLLFHLATLIFWGLVVLDTTNSYPIETDKQIKYETSKPQTSQTKDSKSTQKAGAPTKKDPVILTSEVPKDKPQCGNAPQQNKESHKQKKSNINDTLSIILAVLLTLFNGLLAFFTWRLWKATSGLWVAAKQQSKDIKQSIIVAKETADAVRTQAETMHRELVLTQRPRLRVTNVVTKNFPDPFGINEPIKGQLYITNIGGMPAQITNIGCWVKVLEGGLPMERPYEGENPNHPNMSTKLMPGQSITLPFDSDIMRKGAYDEIRGGLSGCILYVMGYVEYVDDIGTPRKTSFCRQYRLPGDRQGEDRRTTRFFAVKDPDYEYEA